MSICPCRLARPLAPLLLLAAAAPSAAVLQAGEWSIHAEPGTASLDGRMLKDLPYSPPAQDQSVCLDAAQAADPARWFARDMGRDCQFSRRDIRDGRIDIAGTCPAPDAGQPASRFHLAGRWDATHYTMQFATETQGVNGRMGFTGTTSATRTGACPS